MIELYNTEALATDRAQIKRRLIVMLLVAAAGLIPCVALIALATRRNQHILLPLAIGIAWLSGWVFITILHGSFAKANARRRHDETMLNEPRERMTGRFTKTDEVRRMKNGMEVRKVLLLEDGRERVLSVNEAKAQLLPDAFMGAADTVYDFIVAYEVNGDD
jgi:hypothetical protein